MENRMLGAALVWAKFVPIFPCKPNAKEPDCPHGFKNATSNVEQITSWWTEEPMRNIAACPDNAGCFVLDVDSKEGFDTLLQWEIENKPLPRTLRIRTPSGGMHVWLRGSRPSSVKKIAPGIDVRGIGGYCLLPPSIVDGKEYAFIAG